MAAVGAIAMIINILIVGLLHKSVPVENEVPINEIENKKTAEMPA